MSSDKRNPLDGVCHMVVTEEFIRFAVAEHLRKFKEYMMEPDAPNPTRVYQMKDGRFKITFEADSADA